jgi:hypothetical protein
MSRAKEHNEHFIKCQQQCFPSAATVVGVFDRYDKKLSIKSAERDRRSSSFGDHKVFQLIESRLIMLEAEWRICSSEISLQAADMPTCSVGNHFFQTLSKKASGLKLLLAKMKKSSPCLSLDITEHEC